jgi:hypothetical protein
VLLIVVAAIGAMLVYLWFASYVTKATSQAESMAVSEKLKIEAANLTSSRGALFIRNLGGNNVTIAIIYILRPYSMNPLCTNSTPIQIFRGTSTATATAQTLFPGRLHLVRFNIPANCGINFGNDYVIKIVTQRGTEYAVMVNAS